MAKYTTEQERKAAYQFYPDGIPATMRARRRWVCWRFKLDDKGKWTKVPVRADNPSAGADTSDSDTWATFEQTVVTAQRECIGIGYVLLNETGVDLDYAVDADGKLEPWAAEIVAQLNSYTEWSPSRTGVKIYTTSKLKPDKHKVMLGRFEGDEAAIEIYDRDRYFCVTGVPYVAE